MTQTILERTRTHTVMKITAETPEQLDRVRVMSGKTLERTDTTLTVELTYNDSLLVNGVVVLWWDQDEGTLVRQ